MAEGLAANAISPTQLPKLSTAEYQVYNSMAEHMEYFVSVPLTRVYHYGDKQLNVTKAQQFPADLEAALRCLL